MVAAEDAAIRHLGTLLAARVEEVADEVARHVLAEMPELGAEADGHVLVETLDSGRANIGAVASMLAYGIPGDTIAPPHGAVEFARAMIRRGVDLPAVLRAYRVGHAALWDAWVRIAARELADDGPLLAATLRSSSMFMFRYIDAVCVRLVEECDAERDRWRRTAVAARAEAVRTVLGDAPGDVDAASRALRYELRRHHVALVAWRVLGDDDATGDADARLEGAVRTAAAALGRADALLVPAGRGLLWAWVGADAPFDEAALEALAALAPPAGVHLAAGEPGRGADGFRRSHDEADRALRVTTLGGRPPAGVVRYKSVAFLSTLCADPAQARAFAAHALGPLADGDPAQRVLRTTLAAFLDAGCSHVRAARSLGVHEKTVTYRVRRAEDLLGGPVSERRVELAAALRVAELLDATS